MDQHQGTSSDHCCSKHRGMTELPSKVECKDAPCDQHRSWLATMLSQCDQGAMEHKNGCHDADKAPSRHASNTRDAPDGNEG